MLPYWLFYGAYALSALNRNARREAVAVSPLPWIAAALATILFIGLRYKVGGDWGNYENIFNFTSTELAEALKQGDPGYMALNWFAKEIGVGIVFVNACCAILFTWGLFRFAKYEPNPWLAILVAVPYFIIVVSMGYTRQAVAIAMLMAGIVEFLSGRYIRLLAYVLVAALFHKTAIVVLPLVGISIVKHRVLTWTVLALFGVFLFQLVLGNAMDRLATNYIESGMESGGATVRVMMNVLPAVVFLFFSRRFSRSEQERKLWRNFSLAALVSAGSLYFLTSTTLVDRLALYLVPLQLVVFGRVPYAATSNGRPNSQLMLLVLVYSAAVQFVWLTYATHADRWVPYRSYLLSPDIRT